MLWPQPWPLHSLSGWVDKCHLSVKSQFVPLHGQGDILTWSEEAEWFPGPAALPPSIPKSPSALFAPQVYSSPGEIPSIWYKWRWTWTLVYIPSLNF